MQKKPQLSRPLRVEPLETRWVFAGNWGCGSHMDESVKIDVESLSGEGEPVESALIRIHRREPIEVDASVSSRGGVRFVNFGFSRLPSHEFRASRAPLSELDIPVPPAGEANVPVSNHPEPPAEPPKTSDNSAAATPANVATVVTAIDLPVRLLPSQSRNDSPTSVAAPSTPSTNGSDTRLALANSSPTIIERSSEHRLTPGAEQQNLYAPMAFHQVTVNSGPFSAATQTNNTRTAYETPVQPDVRHAELPEAAWSINEAAGRRNELLGSVTADESTGSQHLERLLNDLAREHWRNRTTTQHRASAQQRVGQASTGAVDADNQPANALDVGGMIALAKDQAEMARGMAGNSAIASDQQHNERLAWLATIGSARDFGFVAGSDTRSSSDTAAAELPQADDALAAVQRHPVLAASSGLLGILAVGLRRWRRSNRTLPKIRP